MEKIPEEAYHGHGREAEHHGSEHDTAAHPGADAARARQLESPAIMTWPLRILALGALFAGIVLGPTGLLETFLEEHWLRTALSGGEAAEPMHDYVPM